MLRATLPTRVVFQNPYSPRVLGKMTPQRMELTMIIVKERKKKLRYLGSYFQHYNDRSLMYNAQGGVRRGTRFIIGTHHTRAQFKHPSRYNDRVDVRSIKVGGAQYDSMGNTTTMGWDNSLCSTNILSDPTFMHFFQNIRKDEAIGMMEEWGMRYVLLDEVRKPSLMDCMYHKHHLFADKFSWSPDPDTNAMRGDSEYKWKGDELIEYGDYNAHTPHPDSFSSSAGPSPSAASAATPNPWFHSAVAQKRAQATQAARASPAAPPKAAPAPSKTAAAGTAANA